MGHSGRAVSRPPGAPRLCAALLPALALAGCTLIFPRTLTIVRWSPDSPRPDPAGISIWVEFSGEVDATSAEQGFTLTEDGSAMRGEFSWDGSRLTFQPIRPVSTGKQYVMSVSSSVEDSTGVSLHKEFRFAFSTQAESVRPAVRATTPASDSTVDDRYMPITLEFTERMDPVSVLHAFSISPARAGSFSWSPDGTTLTFTPCAPYSWQTRYLVRIGSEAADQNCNTLAEEYLCRFFVGSDQDPPLLLDARNLEGTLPGSRALVVDDPGTPGLPVTMGWECTWGVQLTFSEPVTRESLEGRVVLEPGCPVSIEPRADAGSMFVVRPDERLPWDCLFTLTLLAGISDRRGNATPGDAVMLFRTDSVRSRPPRVMKVRFRGTPLTQPARVVDFDPAVPLACLPVSADDFPVGSVLATWFDVQLSLADDAGLDILSAAEHLVIQETGGCLCMTATGLQAAGFDDPQPESVEGAVPLRVIVLIANAAASGTVTIGFAEGFADSRGNPLAADWQLHFLK